MNLFKEQIKIEQKRIQRLIDLTGIPERQADMGSLHLEMRGKSICCFEQKYDHGKRISKKYLGSKNTPRVKQLVAIRVAEERLRHLEYNQNLLKKLETRYMDYDMEAILKDLPKAYRMAAIQETFDEQYEKVRKWANGDWKRNTAPFSDAATFAKDGTHVRSKGECLYYNMLLEHGLLFVYDCYMTFTNRLGEKRQFCPDFVIRCLDGTIIIIEHLGRLHDLRYAMNFAEKCNWYIQNGYVLGKNYFVTSDDVNGGTDSRAILEVVEKVERLFYGY